MEGNTIHVIMRSLIKTLNYGESPIAEMVYIEHLKMVYIEHLKSGKVLSFVKDATADAYHMLSGHDASHSPLDKFHEVYNARIEEGWRETSEFSFDIDMDDPEEMNALAWEFRQMLNIKDGDEELSRLMNLVKKMHNQHIGNLIKEGLKKMESKIATTNSELLGSW